MSWYYIDSAGTTQGPVEKSVLVAKWNNGIDGTTYVWNGTTVNQWSLIKDTMLHAELNKPKPKAPTGGSRPSPAPKRPKPASGGRANLLDAIRSGKKLKKTTQPAASAKPKPKADKKPESDLPPPSSAVPKNRRLTITPAQRERNSFLDEHQALSRSNPRASIYNLNDSLDTKSLQNDGDSKVGPRRLLTRAPVTSNTLSRTVTQMPGLNHNLVTQKKFLTERAELRQNFSIEVDFGGYQLDSKPTALNIKRKILGRLKD